MLYRSARVFGIGVAVVPTMTLAALFTEKMTLALFVSKFLPLWISSTAATSSWSYQAIKVWSLGW
jgi:hypothetical protein